MEFIALRIRSSPKDTKDIFISESCDFMCFFISFLVDFMQFFTI